MKFYTIEEHEMTKRDEIKKWNWKVEWCKENKLSHSNSESWEKADQAWGDQYKPRSRPPKNGSPGIAIIGATSSMSIM